MDLAFEKKVLHTTQDISFGNGFPRPKSVQDADIIAKNMPPSKNRVPCGGYGRSDVLVSGLSDVNVIVRTFFGELSDGLRVQMVSKRTR